MAPKKKASEYRFVRPMTKGEHQHFVNSLRHALGLMPLYGEAKNTPWYIPFMGDGNRRRVTQ